MPTFLTPLVQPMLEAAVESNDAVKARLALSLGADANVVVSVPLLHRAANLGRVQLVEALLKGGAKTTAKDPDGDTALLTSLRGTLIMDPKKAAVSPKKSANQMLEGKATSKAKAWTPMQQGGKKVADKTTTWVLDEGGNISDRGGERGQRKLPPTAFATVVTLLNGGASPNASGQGGMTYRQTPLMLAAQWGSPEIVHRLIKAGANVNAHDSDGETVLMYAVAEGIGDVIKPIIKAGANLNAVNAGGFTALHAAAQFNRAQAITILIAAGADLNMRNNKGMTPVDLAVAMHNVLAAKAIVAATNPTAAAQPAPPLGNYAPPPTLGARPSPPPGARPPTPPPPGQNPSQRPPSPPNPPQRPQ